MKKRLFAGALALLMIIGLLPVSSMLKKPVEAQAASTKKSYEAETNFENDVSVGDCIGDSQDSSFFKVGVKSISSSSSKIKFAKAGEISFEVKGEEADIELKWEVPKNTNNTTYVNIIDAATNEVVATSAHNGKKSEVYPVKYKITKKGTYIIKNVGDRSILVSGLKVTVPAYTININDSKAPATDTSKVVVVGEGEDIPLKAATEANFLYWETSHGRIASREPNPSTPLAAYYDETYTAVYGSDVTTVYYMTKYGHVYKSIAADDFNENVVPDVPTLYGYKAKSWLMDAASIKAEIDKKETKAIFVDPDYDIDKVTTYDITVDKTAVDGGIVEEKDKVINTVYTVSTDASNFAYWYDADAKKILSYNSTYSFFVNKNINIVLVVGSVEQPKGVISLVLKDDGKVDDKDSVVVFEYTVPTGCTVTFAGVYASPNAENLGKNAEYIDGGSFSSDQTFKYTITKRKGMATWYVKAVLEYTDSEGNPQETIYYGPVEF